MTYILIDTANTFFRARHVVRGDIDTKVGMAMHITLNSIKKAWQDFNGSHVVFCLEGRSWRKDYYEPYKRNRKEHRDAMSPREAEEDKIFWEIFDEFKDFVGSKTNCTVLHNSVLEADDLIAGWIQNHPNDKHVIVSTDGDFAQLISPNVQQYNGVSNTIITHEGYFDDKKREPVVDKKTGQPKPAPDPAFMLFEKCMRGDTSDNVFSAYPGVRKKGTKNKVGLIEAFEDKATKGFNWNNMMLQRWVDHNGALSRTERPSNRAIPNSVTTTSTSVLRAVTRSTLGTIRETLPPLAVAVMAIIDLPSLALLAPRIKSTEPPVPEICRPPANSALT